MLDNSDRQAQHWWDSETYEWVGKQFRKYVVIGIILGLVNWVLPSAFTFVPAFVALPLLFITILGVLRLLAKNAVITRAIWTFLCLFAALFIIAIYAFYLDKQHSSEAITWWWITLGSFLILCVYVWLSPLRAKPKSDNANSLEKHT